MNQARTFLGLCERKGPLSRGPLSYGQKPASGEEMGAPREGCEHFPWVV